MILNKYFISTFVEIKISKMSFESFVTERLAAITGMLNAYNTNAKTIAELPAQNTLDPSSLIHVSRGGVSEKLAIQKIIDSILSYQFNKLISVSGDITVAGNTVTVPAAAWVMDNVNYHTNTDTVLTVPFAELGYTRTDFIVADKFNTIYRVAGPETQGVSPAPNQPIDTVYITKIEVTDSSLANPEPPFIGEEFKLKSESYDFIVNYPDAVIEQITLPDNRNILSLTGVVTDIKSTQIATEFMYSGKSHFVKNNSGRIVTVWHNAGTGNVKYSFPNAVNYKLRPGEILEFVLNTTDSNNLKNEFVGIISDLGLIISSATEKLTANDNDKTGIADSEDSNKTKYWKFSTIKSTLKTYFDALYLGISNDQTVSGIKTFLAGKLGLRNNANTFTSFFSNANTASRIYTLQNRNGTLLDDTDLTAINNSIATKQASLAGVTNYLPKSTSPTALGPSRVQDTGTYIGIDTVNAPSKDITLGKQANRIIGVEQSNSTTVGRDLSVEAGRTINYVDNANFIGLSQSAAVAWAGMCSVPNGDVYACADGTTGIYKQAGGVGDFISTGEVTGGWWRMAGAPNGDVYAGKWNTGILYKRTGGTGTFNSVTTITGGRINGIAVALNGDVYVASITDIFKQTGGSGSWTEMTAHPNGNIYACVSGGDIYMQTGGTGNFAPLGQTSRNWIGIEAAPNGNVYACVANGDIYMQTNGVGNFVALGQTIRNYQGITVSVTGDTYVCVPNVDIYKQNNNALGSANLDGGTLNIKSGTGKGSGKSRIHFITGQKAVSGTDMQIETLRAYIDENGFLVYLTLPTYANDAAADADSNLPSKAFYKITGNRTLYQKP
jgi:hypothetical protein